MKSVLQITCDECKSYLPNYLHNNTSSLLRRRVARHLDQCRVCYSLYLQELDVMQVLKREIPQLGIPTSASLDQVWGSIQAELQQSNPPRFQMRFGLATLALILVFLVPMTLGNRNITFVALPTPPQPVSARLTPGITAPSITQTTVALLTDDIQTTPEAPGITAPALEVMSTPEHEG